MLTYLKAHGAAVQKAAAQAPGQWKTWYWVCFGGFLFFLASIPLLRGRWKPSSARRDEEEHEAMVDAELAKLQHLNPGRAARRVSGPAPHGRPPGLALPAAGGSAALHRRGRPPGPGAGRCRVSGQVGSSPPDPRAGTTPSPQEVRNAAIAVSVWRGRGGRAAAAGSREVLPPTRTD